MSNRRQHHLFESHMVLMVSLALQLAIVAAARSLQQSSDPQAIFFPSTCDKVCTKSEDFHLPLPSAPNLAVGNRATQWGVALLVQVRSAEATIPEQVLLASNYWKLAESEAGG